MKKKLAVAGGVTAIVGLGALGGCEMLAITAMNMVETTRFTVTGEALFMSGEINTKTRDQFEAVIAANPQVTVLVECNVPGSLDDDTMIALAYRVRALGLDTYLTFDSEIASGGVDLFIAGVNRTVSPGARIGVHSWSDGFRQASDYPRDAPEHEANRKYIADMLGEDSFYWYTIYAASADDIYWMTDYEVAQYNLATTPQADQTTYTCPAA